MAGGSGPGSAFEALGVRRRARRGFAAGFVLAAVMVATVAAQGSAWLPLYLGLGVVLWLAAGLLVTTALVAVAAYRLAGG